MDVDTLEEGDRITLEHDDGSRLVGLEVVRDIQGLKVVRVLERMRSVLSFIEVSVLSFIEVGWRIVAHEPKVSLPTERGWYQARDNGDVFYLAADGAWTTPVEYGAPATDVERFAPFTRLEPRPVTAKAVLERVAEILRGVDLPIEFGSLAREFGVDL